MDLRESQLLGDDAAKHWYYQSKAAALMRYLSGVEVNRILDVGAGSGFFTRYLLEHGKGQSGLCVDTGYAAERDEAIAGKRLSFRRSIERDDADLVLLMDVLEHVDDAADMLASYVGKVPAHATFLLTVPAHQWLWSGHDVFLGHRRRYNVAQVDRLVEGAGLRVAMSSYFFGLVLPLAAVLRVAKRMAVASQAAPASQLVRHGRLVNLLLAGACRCELPFMTMNRLAGLSVFCLARKAG